MVHERLIFFIASSLGEYSRVIEERRCLSLAKLSIHSLLADCISLQRVVKEKYLLFKVEKQNKIMLTVGQKCLLLTFFMTEKMFAIFLQKKKTLKFFYG